VFVEIEEFKANFETYLAQLAREEIVIRRDGKAIARMESVPEPLAQPAPFKLSETAKPWESWPHRATYEEFLELTSGEEQQFEYIDGEIYLMTSPRVIHQSVLGELYRIFADWLDGKGCKAFLAPLDITLRRTATDINVVQPDLMVICDLDQHLGNKGQYTGIPLLLVEILSESTRSKDSLKKYDLYAATGISEYWIINPLSQEISVMRFEQGRLAEGRISGAGESAASMILRGLSVEVDQLFR
jgi:Uma2 family endonuclease